MTPGFREAGSGTTIRGLGLAVEGTRLEPLVAQLHRELADAGLSRLRPEVYLAGEWGVPFGTTAIAVPFYLARPDLTALHAERAGHVEGAGRADVMRYLRHEAGHAVNYAYRLYERPDWAATFGPFDRDYLDEYHFVPFSREFVRHLPGWYAQKHPDEDWAETFAVWLTPGRDWRAEYDGWPVVLDKLGYVDRVVAEVGGLDPLSSEPFGEGEGDGDELAVTLDEYYGSDAAADAGVTVGFLDAALTTLFEDDGWPEDASPAPRLPAADLIRRLGPALVDQAYRWGGYFPERSRPLVRALAERAAALGQVYRADREAEAAAGVAALVTAVAVARATG